MGLLDRHAPAWRDPFRDNIAALLVSTLLLAAPMLALMLHCIYHTFYSRHASWGMSHGFSTPFEDAHLPSSFLYVASYSWIVTTLNLTRGRQGGTPLALEHVSTTEGCAGSPSWLTLDHPNSILYCTDEGLKDGRNGSLSSLRTTQDGKLTPLDQVPTVLGPVSAVLYGERSQGLAVAHYGGSAFTTWNIQDPANLTSVEVRNFKLSEPGPDPSRQEAPHPHAAALDPSGHFVLVPDLGADLVRVYSVEAAGLALTELDPLVVAAGSGPRHVAFAVKETRTFMYLVTELGNTIVGYEVTYGSGSIAFAEIWNSGTHGKDEDVPEGAAASEIVVSSDSKFLILSSRNESSLHIPNFDAENSTSIISDPLINFEIDAETGHLTLRQEVPSGGRWPRQFAINKAGTLVAVALQGDGRVVVIERDVENGVLGDFVAYAEVGGEVTAVIFHE